MSSRMPKPHRKKNGLWRGQVTLKNGKRPAKDFHTYAEAAAWIADTLANSNAENAPILGGPTQARLADMLDYYVRHVTIAKAGADQEIRRANHYLVPAGLPELALWTNENGQSEIVPLTERKSLLREARGDTAPLAATKRKGSRNEAGVTPQGFKKRNDTRGPAAYPRTYELYAALAIKRASQITGADMRALHSTMTAEKYSASTIQKEIALLKAVFNESQANWHWPVAHNPCAGIKLKPGARRFIIFTDEHRERVVNAVTQCDNPVFWPLVEFALETAVRQTTLLNLNWEHISLQDSKLYTDVKRSDSFIPLSPRAIQILEGLPCPRQGRVFDTTTEAITQAWRRIREKAGLPNLMFRDLRHVAPTMLARAGMNAHFLRDVLGHKTTTQAEIYINLTNQDVVDALKLLAPDVKTPLPPVASDWKTLQAQNKARRLNEKAVVLIEQEREGTAKKENSRTVPEPTSTLAPATSNIIAFPSRGPASEHDTLLPDAEKRYTKWSSS